MAAPSPHRWWILASAASALALAFVVLFTRKPPRQAPQPPARTPAAPVPCEVPRTLALTPMPEADGPPVLLWGVGTVRLSVDGERAFSAPEEPRHFAVGEHELKVEADGATPLITRFRLDPFVPALFHAELSPDSGLTLIRLGADCTSCPARRVPVQLDYRPSQDSVQFLLNESAAALRQDDWPVALDLLRGVPGAQRSSALFHRLASAVHAGAVRQPQARAELSAIPVAEGNDLAPLLEALGRLEHSEAARRLVVLTARWNKVTERFGAMVQRFEAEVPGRVEPQSKRLEVLSTEFADAAARADASRQASLLFAAQTALGTLAEEIRSARPEDCAFQAEVAALATH